MSLCTAASYMSVLDHVCMLLEACEATGLLLAQVLHLI